MQTYSFRLLDLTPNVVTCTSIFANLCKNFVGTVPNTALFWHYFTPRIQKGDALSGSITWIPWGCKEAYLEGTLREKWEEWRGKWFWIREKGFLTFCEPRTAKIEARGGDWSNLDPQDKLTVVTTRIQRLKAVGLTIEMVGADFLLRRIATLHNKGRPAWEYRNAANIMRLRPGLNTNLTVIQLSSKSCSTSRPTRCSGCRWV